MVMPGQRGILMGVCFVLAEAFPVTISLVRRQSCGGSGGRLVSSSAWSFWGGWPTLNGRAHRTFTTSRTSLGQQGNEENSPCGQPKFDAFDDVVNEVENLLSDLSHQSKKQEQSTMSIDRGWRCIDWNAAVAQRPAFSPEYYNLVCKGDLRPTSCPDKPSPVEKARVRDREVYVKRDDLLRLRGSYVNGNKARKMFALNALATDDFPECVVSYGGPQSNAMLALAAIVNSKNVELNLSSLSTELESPIPEEMNELYIFSDDADNWAQSAATSDAIVLKGAQPTETLLRPKRFVYFTKALPRFLRNQPNGNLFRAKSLGMEIIELTNNEYNDLFGSESGGRPEAPAGLVPPVPGDSLWVPQGGACGVAVPGGRMLAEEIVSFWSREGQGRPLSVCVPGGTCTTALLLHREIKDITANMTDGEMLDIRVVVIPCVGDDAYARRQMMALNDVTGGEGQEDSIPAVLTPGPDVAHYGQSRKRQRGYFNFGEPDAAIIRTFREMEEEYGIYLDLLYGAPSWTLLLEHWSTKAPPQVDFHEINPIAGREVMYVHSGGLEGISSQLMRYKYKGLVPLEDVQLPMKRGNFKPDGSGL